MEDYPNSQDISPQRNNRKRNLILAGIFIFILFVIFILFFISGGKKNQSAYQTSQPIPGNESSPPILSSQSQIKFSNRNAYQVFPTTNSEKTQKALLKFNSPQIQSFTDGGAKIKLSTKEPGYEVPEFILKTGEKLYVINRTVDYPNQADMDTGDIYFVVVDSSGYIVKE